MWSKGLVLGLAAWMVSGCAVQVSKSYGFDKTNDDGLVAIGIQSTSGPYSIHFKEMDPTNCQSLNRAGIGDKKFDFSLYSKASEQHYIIDTFTPGTWVIGSISYNTGYKSTLSVSLGKGSLAFTVKPGEFLYLGDITIAKTGAMVRGFDMDALEEELTEYPNLHEKPKVVEQWGTPYGDVPGEPVPGCRPHEPNGDKSFAE